MEAGVPAHVLTETGTSVGGDLEAKTKEESLVNTKYSFLITLHEDKREGAMQECCFALKTMSCFSQSSSKRLRLLKNLLFFYVFFFNQQDPSVTKPSDWLNIRKSKQKVILWRKMSV